MKRNAYPPLIILLDLLFMLLFMFILTDEKNISISMKGNDIANGAKIYHYDNALKAYVDEEKIPYQKNGNTWPLKCEQQIKCITAREKYGDNIVIVLPDDLFRKIMEITFFSIESKFSGCDHVKFIISQDGNLDRETLKESSCLEKIPGLKEHYFGE